MDFRILGPLEVSDDGRPIPVARPKQRALLAALLLRAGEVVSVDRLLDDLWGESPPPSARASLQNAVSMLRRLLGADVLVTRPPGYVLDVPPESVDLVRFERLVERAREQEPAARAAALREALALWRGPALADVAFERFAEVEVERLEELRAGAREELVDAELALGRHEAVVPALEAMVAEHPFRERPRAQLMLALYRAGRQAEALEAYQEARRFFDEELGLEPGLPLRELQRAILRQDAALAAPAREPLREALGVERRQTVTVLFADLVESTALAAALDPEAYRSVIVRYYERARATLERHGGAVEKFIGDAVVAVFGIPRRHEDDALRAVRAAGELVEGAGRLSAEVERAHGVGLRLRVGVNTGEAVVGESSPRAAGYAVNVAAKLEQTAAPGDVLLGPATYRLVRDAVTTEALQPLAVGGTAAPLPVFRLTGVVPGAEPIVRRLEAPLVGRGRELAELRRAFDEARRAGACRVVTVAGDAGIGKTRLATELADALRGEATVVTGRCPSYGAGAAYLPIAEVVRTLVPDGSEPGIAALLGDDPDAALVARRVRELTGLAEGAAPAQEGPWAVRRLLQAAARRRPLLLVLEDVHWAEPALLDLVEQLAGTEDGGPMLVLCLARPDLLEARPAWPVTLALDPLSDAEANELVANLPVAAELAGAARARIVEAAGGNALFAEQLATDLSETGGEELSVPPTLEALLAGRLDRLSRGERLVLECAAVLGREFTAAAAEQLSGADASAAVEQLVAKGLVHEAAQGALAFHHVLIRDVAYAEITKRRRSELHEQAAEWLDDHGGLDELVGYHLEQAHRYRVELGPADRHARRLAAEAGERLGAAGVRAWRVGDANGATNLLGRAAALLPEGHAAAPETLRELAGGLWAIGEPARAEETLSAAVDAAAAAGNRGLELRGRVDLAYLRLFIDPEGRAEELLDLATQAIPVLEALEDDLSLGRTWLAVAFVHGGAHGRFAASEEAAERALAHYRRRGWMPAMCVRELAAAVYYGPRPVGDAVRHCRALLEGADRGGRASLWTYMAGLEGMRGRSGAARRLAADARQICEELGWYGALATMWAPVAAHVELLARDLDAAERILRDSCAYLEQAAERSSLATQAGRLARLLVAGRAAEEAERWAKVSETSAANDDLSAQLAWRGARAILLARRGALRDAEELARDAVSRAEASDALDHRASALLDLAEVLGLAGRDGSGRDCVRRALALYEQKGNRAAARTAEKLLGQLAPA